MRSGDGGPPGGSVCWMLTLTVPRVEGTRPRRSGPARGLIARPEPRFGPCVWPDRRGEWSAWMRSAAKALGLKSLRPVAFVLPCSGCVGFGCFGPPKAGSERKFASVAYTTRSCESQRRQNAILVAFVNSAPIVSTDCVILAAIAAPFLPQTPVPDLSGAVAQVSGEFFVLTRYCRQAAAVALSR